MEYQISFLRIVKVVVPEDITTASGIVEYANSNPLAAEEIVNDVEVENAKGEWVGD